jgi:hypothetical protein
MLIKYTVIASEAKQPAQIVQIIMVERSEATCPLQNHLFIDVLNIVQTNIIRRIDPVYTSV